MNFEAYYFNSDLREMLDNLLRLFDVRGLLMNVRALLFLRFLLRISHLLFFSRRLLVLLCHGNTLLLAFLCIP
jgi:hypothetical protein